MEGEQRQPPQKEQEDRLCLLLLLLWWVEWADRLQAGRVRLRQCFPSGAILSLHA